MEQSADINDLIINPLPFALDVHEAYSGEKRLDFNCPFWREVRTLLQLLPIIGKL